MATIASFPGWGEKLARRALEKYETFEKMCQSSPEDMAKTIYGCGLSKSAAFFEHLREKYKDVK